MTTNDKILNGSGLSTVLGLVKNKIDLKQDAPLIGSTSGENAVTYAQMVAAIQAGRDIYISYTDEDFGEIIFTDGWAYSPSMDLGNGVVISTRLFMFNGNWNNVELICFESPFDGKTWKLLSTQVAEYTDIPTVPTNVSELNNDANYIDNTALTPYVAKSEVLPVQGITGPVIATIGGVTIHAPFAEGGVTQETDPIFTQSAAYGITSTDISNWNAKSDITPVQPDWTQTITTSLDYIKNKPILPEYNILSYEGENASAGSGVNFYHILSTDVIDGTTHTYQIPAYTPTPTHNNQVTTKKYVDDSITDAVTTAISGITSISFDTSYTTYAEMSAQAGEAGVIYLIPNSGTTPNIYDEYIYANSSYEKIGTTEVDLSNYVQAEDIADFITATSLTPYLQKSEISVAQGLTTGIEIGSISIDSVTTTLYAPSAAEGFHKVVLSENSGVYSITSSGDTFASIKQRLDNNQVVYVTISGDSTIYHINSIDSSELTFRNISNTTWKNISITSASVTVTNISISQTNNILEIK